MCGYRNYEVKVDSQSGIAELHKHLGAPRELTMIDIVGEYGADGGQVIKLPEFMNMFPIDTPENRDLVRFSEYCLCVEYGHTYQYVKKISREKVSITESVQKALKAPLRDLKSFYDFVTEKVGDKDMVHVVAVPEKSTTKSAWITSEF